MLHPEHTFHNQCDEIKDDYAAEVGKIKVGDVKDLSNFLGAVIDKKSFDNIKGYIDRAAAEPGCSFVTGNILILIFCPTYDYPV